MRRESRHALGKPLHEELLHVRCPEVATRALHLSFDSFVRWCASRAYCAEANDHGGRDGQKSWAVKGGKEAVSRYVRSNSAAGCRGTFSLAGRKIELYVGSESRRGGRNDANAHALCFIERSECRTAGQAGQSRHGDKFSHAVPSRDRKRTLTYAAHCSDGKLNSDQCQRIFP